MVTAVCGQTAEQCFHTLFVVIYGPMYSTC